ncbi:unnamed protein product [Auanema sp. JU1783]|nr:unnamed protein product [Auanema sp. JU1783]
MRLGEEDEPSTSRNYMPYVAADRKDGLFGYDKNIVIPPPWSKKRYSLCIEGLHEEILDVYNWLKPSTLEKAIRYKVFERVQETIKEKWKDNEVNVSVFGSLRTQLFLPTSDIDVLVECNEWGNDLAGVLQATAEALKASGMAETISVYGEAFVPIVKMVDKDTRLSIDISFNTVQGVKAADYIERVKHEFPVVEPLVLILKQFLIQRNLNQTYTGGLSSYGLILMLISFLQIYGMPVRTKSMYSPGVNLGELLMRFFEVYAQEFNYLEVGISVHKCCYKKKCNKPGDMDAVLSLEDPLLPTNEVGRSTFNFVGIQTAFAQALQVLKGVFVHDRRKNRLFNSKLYGGSMLSLIMPLTPQQIQYRNWLKSFSMTYPGEPVRASQLITNTFLAPVVNLDTLDWHTIAFAAPKHSKRLTISPPEEKNAAKSDEEAHDRRDKNRNKWYPQSDSQSDSHSPNENNNRNKPNEFYNDLNNVRNSMNYMKVDDQQSNDRISREAHLYPPNDNYEQKSQSQKPIYMNNRNGYHSRPRNDQNQKYKKMKKGMDRRGKNSEGRVENHQVMAESTPFAAANCAAAAVTLTECMRSSDDGENSEQGSVKSVCI